MNKSKIKIKNVRFEKTLNFEIYNKAGYKITLQKAIIYYDNNISLFFENHYNDIEVSNIYLDRFIIDGVRQERCMLDCPYWIEEEYVELFCLDLNVNKKNINNTISFVLNIREGDDGFDESKDYFCDYSSPITIDILRKERLVKINGKLSIDDRLQKLEEERADLNKKIKKIISLLGNNNDNSSKEYKIDFADFVVRSNVFKCNQNHKIEQIQAVVDVMTSSGNIISEKISAGYCLICKCYFILETDYNRLRAKGVLLCQQLTYEVYRKNGLAIMNGDELKPESLLHQSGYNVSANEDLSSCQRQEILRRVIDNGLYTISGICSHLDWLIGRNNKVRNRDMSLAIAKWKEDRAFISNYKTEKQREVKINSISVKKNELPF